jgi:hypothetical protein
VDPALRKVKPDADGSRSVLAIQDAEDGDLAVLDLSQPPAPLPRHANGEVSLLLEAALVKDQAAVGVASHASVNVLCNLAKNGAFIPLGLAEEMLEDLFVGPRYGLFHPEHVSSIRHQESAHILLCPLETIRTAGAEEASIPCNPFMQVMRQAPQPAVGTGFSPPTSFIGVGSYPPSAALGSSRPLKL